MATLGVLHGITPLFASLTRKAAEGLRKVNGLAALLRVGERIVYRWHRSTPVVDVDDLPATNSACCPNWVTSVIYLVVGASLALHRHPYLRIAFRVIDNRNGWFIALKVSKPYAAFVTPIAIGYGRGSFRAADIPSSGITNFKHAQSVV